MALNAPFYNVYRRDRFNLAVAVRWLRLFYNIVTITCLAFFQRSFSAWLGFCDYYSTVFHLSQLFETELLKNKCWTVIFNNICITSRSAMLERDLVMGGVSVCPSHAGNASKLMN